MSTQTLPAAEPENRPARTRERVLFAPITEMRISDPSQSGDGSWTMSGYAAVYEQETTLYSSPHYTEREIISRGAFDAVLASNPMVHLNHGHDMKTAVASTRVPSGIGSLELSSDTHGLRFVARVDPEDIDARQLAVKMKRGIVTQASFAFTIDDQEPDQDIEGPEGQVSVRWRINRVGSLFDVCACAQGAYPQTESAVRSLFGTHFGHSGEPEGHQGHSPIEGPTQVTEETRGSPVTETPDEDQARRARQRDRFRVWISKETQ